MKALSLWEPWGTLVKIGAKEYETRHWSTKYRGPVLIHTAKHDRDLKAALTQRPYRSVLFEAGYTKLEHFHLGCALGIVDLVDIQPTEEVRGMISQQEKSFGNYADRRFAWRLENIRAFDKPIPMKGMQGLFDVEQAILPEIRDQMIMWHREHGTGIVRCPSCLHVAPGDREIRHDAACAEPGREMMS